MNFIVKTALKIIVKSVPLQIKVFLFLAQRLAEKTENEFDDQFVEILREALGATNDEVAEVATEIDK